MALMKAIELPAIEPPMLPAVAATVCPKPPPICPPSTAPTTAPPMAPATDAPVDASVVSWIASTTPVPLMFAPGDVVAHPASASTKATSTTINRRTAYSPSAFR